MWCWSTQQDSLAEQGKAGAAVGLAFQELDLVVDAFGWTVAVGQPEAGFGCRAVLPDARHPDKVGNCRSSGGLVLAGGRVCPVLLRAPDRCQGSASGWLGPGSALGPIAKRRVAPWRRPPGSGDSCGRGQGEASVFQGVHCWVRVLGAGWLGVMPPWGVVCHAGQVAQRVWCVAPSLTLVLEPC